MKIVAQDGSVNFGKWEYNGHTYEIVATDGKDRNISVWEALDTVKRNDGKRHQFKRRELNSHFKNIIAIENHDEIKTTEKKKDKSSRQKSWSMNLDTKF